MERFKDKHDLRLQKLGPLRKYKTTARNTKVNALNNLNRKITTAAQKTK